MAEVKLHGTWPSPFGYRVIWALKLKGIPFEYVEEDLSNKSALLLQYNPIHKKIPVLVHGGKPVCESMAILHYIEETWPQSPLLPTDPYDRAMSRFWINYVDDKFLEIRKLFYSPKLEWEKITKEIFEMLENVDKRGLLGENKFFNGERIGIVDISFAAVINLLRAIADAFLGLEILEPQKFPRLRAWFENFKQAPIIKEDFPDHDVMVSNFKRAQGHKVQSK